MLFNYIKVAIRNFSRNKLHSFINIIGLAAGIASVYLITLYLQNELSYDQFHDGAENLYRISWEDDNPQTRTPHPMAQAMVHDFPEVQSAVSITPLWGPGLTRETHSFRNIEKNIHFDETAILSVDTTFFDVFSFPVVRGDGREALRHVNGLLISESAAKRYFGEDDPIGKQLAVDSDSMFVEVMAVFKDVPRNSHFHFDFLASYVREKTFDPRDVFFTWADFGHYNYIRLVPGSDPKQLEAKLMPWLRKYYPMTDEQYESISNDGFSFHVRPVTDIHLNSHLRWELEPNGHSDYIYILGAAAFLTLLIACVNFMNLTTAKSTERAKEIGIRKSLGAFRKQLAFQFIGESVLIALMSTVIAALLIELSLPFFNAMTGTTLKVNYTLYPLVLLGLGLFIGVVAGLYPSFLLSSAKPLSIIKGGVSETKQGLGLRDILISFQFAISMALLSGSFIIFSQLNFLRNRELGFTQEGVVVVPVKNENLSERIEPLRNELLKIRGVTIVSATSNIPGKQFNQNTFFSKEFPTDRLAFSECMVDVDFFDALGVQLKEGRLFSRDHTPESSRTFVVNETAAGQLNLKQVIGSEINWDRDDTVMVGRVIGIVKDFHFQSLHEPMRPLLFTLAEEYNFLVIKTNLAGFNDRIAEIEKVYKVFDPIFDFEFFFLDDQLQQQYAGEERLGIVMGAFSGIAMVIACFGLFGMALLSFYQRVKEISIRKVLGASTGNLIYHLLRNFTILILAAVGAATPVTWWLMNRWLENFTFRISIEPTTFIISGLGLLIICWITLGYMTVKTTKLNPAETLKSE